MKRFAVRFLACSALVVGTFLIAPESVVTSAQEIASESSVGEQVIVTVPTAEVTAVQQQLAADKTTDIVALIPQDETTAIVVQVPEADSAVESVSVVDAVVSAAGAHVEADVRRHITQVPNDSLYSLQWHHAGTAGSIKRLS